ncbi:MAG TPA: Na+/H+ antiporter NhaA [Gemmatimonadaceae bacterium]|nr:Na+/H+ antiporter NhaA [Gemmatimonadaceae bacterium]
MARTRATQLDVPIDPARDHVLGPINAGLTLVEYGSYACAYCHAAHEVVAKLRERFGDELTYVYRHLPLTDRSVATKAAELAEYAAHTDNRFWEVHDAFMKGDPDIDERDVKALAERLGVPPTEQRDESLRKRAAKRVRDDAQSGLRSGARMTPTFFINGRRYEGAWDEDALTEALVGSVGQRLQTAFLDFARWAPSIGLLLLFTIIAALGLANSPWGPAVERFWDAPMGIRFRDRAFSLSALDWVNHGLLTVFFLVVGLEIKHEFTVGRLSSRLAATLPVAAAFGGMIIPAGIYVLLAPGELAHGWGVTIATDTAFAVALMVLLGDRVPVHLRVFLTAAVIVDDLVAIGVVAVFYTEQLVIWYLIAAAFVTAMLMAFNRWNIYRVLPYGMLGLVLWFCLHEGGVHATLAGVILAMVIPTRPPPNLRTLTAQAQQVLDAERGEHGDQPPPGGPSLSTLQALEVIYERIESPASKVLRVAEPWSNYFVLPVFALANAGLVFVPGLLDGQVRLVMGLMLGLVVGKPVGILGGAWLAVRFKLAAKPEEYSWRQLAGAGAFGGIGFTMSLFIAAYAYPDPSQFAAAKAAIFAASLLAAIFGVVILLKREKE